MGTLFTLLLEHKMAQPLCKIVSQILKKLKIVLLHDPATLLLGVYSKILKAGSQRDYL